MNPEGPPNAGENPPKAGENSTAPSENSITRRGMELIIRRAIELSYKESDTGDQVSEDELVRIAEELGLSARHVRQAMFEQPEEEPAGFLDRNFGSPTITVTRAIPCDQRAAHSRLEDYLVTREYLQLRRRQGNNALFEPAEDAFSSIARAFSRPSGRFHLARAQRAYLTVRSLEPDWCHVRLELSFPEKRQQQVTTAIAGGMTLGICAAAGGGAIGAALGHSLGDVAMVVGGATGAITFFSATVAGAFAMFRRQYHLWRSRTQDEAEALLDRLEHGDQLEPPASPWLRKLQQRLRGFGSSRHLG